MPRINAQRLLSDLRELRRFGAKGNGVVRPALSATDMEARRWLAVRLEDAGLATTIDGVGNVIGRSPNPGKALLVGSHSDTQPTGGWLDGALGVIYGLEVVRALADDPQTRHLAVDAVSWQDEESRFLGCLGSRSFCGLLCEDAIEGVTDVAGVKLVDALREAGLGGIPRLQAEPGRYLGFVEAHIEQGPTLEAEGMAIGVVSSIVGLGGRVFQFSGQQNHAGTTSMARRRDAATALYDLAYTINQAFPEVASESTVWTMGRVGIDPGAASIVPGRAELELQFRDPSGEVLAALAALGDRLAAEVDARCAADVQARPSRTLVQPTAMDPELREHLAQAARAQVPERWIHMPSGAFHDAGVISAVMPCAMLFIPSIDGISHDFAENSHDEDIVVGCQVLADAAASMLTAANG